ncbi:MAG: ribonuclease P protein component [Candidatus Methylacidiphilales bacterium]
MPAIPNPKGSPRDDLRLPRQRILRKRDAFLKIKTTGQRKASRHLVCNFLDIGQPDLTAFIVPKACGNAVARNRIRRRLKEAYRHFRSHLDARFTMVWIARVGSADVEFATLRDEMKELLNKTGLWQSNP